MNKIFSKNLKIGERILLMEYNIEHFTNSTLSSHGCTEETIHFAPHLHNHFELNLFLQGDIRFFIDGETFKPTHGDLFLMNNTQIHGPKIMSNSTYERAIIHFSPKMVQTFSNQTTELLNIFHQKKGLHLSEEEISEFVTITDKLVELERDGMEEFGNNLLQQAYLAQILVMINRNKYRKVQEDSFLINHELSPLMQEIIQFIQKHLDQHISLAMIEKSFKLNKHYLNRMFKKELDTSIYSFIQLNKISLAKKLLHEEMDVNTVCEQLGYKDYTTFARAFKRVTNLSPKNYVKIIK